MSEDKSQKIVEKAQNEIEQLIENIKKSFKNIVDNAKNVPTSGSNKGIYIGLILISIFVLSGIVLLIVLLTKISKDATIDETKLAKTVKEAIPVNSCDKQETKWMDMIKKSVTTKDNCKSEEERWTKLVNDATEKTQQACALTNNSQDDIYIGDRFSFGTHKESQFNKSKKTPSVKIYNNENFKPIDAVTKFKDREQEPSSDKIKEALSEEVMDRQKKE